MRTSSLVAGIAAIAVTVSSGLALANPEKAIGARKSQMQLYAFHLGLLGGMAKGTVEYDAAAAKAAADNIAALATMNTMAMWPQGSDATAMGDKTRAKLEAWTTWPAIGEESKKMAKASADLAAAAGNGLDALKAAMGPVGGSCKSCHETYRAPKS